ncbi:MAG TPA: DNRLRE domain-containing protein, partial [Thermoanaerobaculia bacterium]|nr:DNRLRE domain-containing protein [Thermoanaerobaculia bacterium]
MDAKKSLLSWLLLGSGLVSVGQGQTIILPPAEDTYLSQTAPNQNNGSATVLSLSSGRALLRFDQTTITSSIGTGRLVSATLELSVSGLWEQGGPPVEAHRLTADWTEAGATWNCAIDTKTTNNKPDCATQWNGGTFAAEPTNTIEPPLPGEKGRFDVTADVAAFLAGTPNRGWLLTTPSYQAGTGQPSFTSREGAVEERPRLILLVSNDQTPPALAILAPANGSVVTTATPTISATYSDDGSGIDVASVRLLLDGADRAAEAQVTAAGLTFTPSAPLAAGAHTVEVTVRDLEANESRATASFTVDLGPALPPDPATVAPPLDPTVAADPGKAVEFLYTGEDPIQTGVTPGTIDARRVAVLRGK